MWESDEGTTVSYWQTSQSGLPRQPLQGSLATDVCVIGAGIAGLTTAYLLVRSGIHAIVIDDGPIGGGETARTTAHLTWAIDDRAYRIARWHGDEHARLAVESHIAAIDTIERLITREDLDCDFSRVDGFLVPADEPDDDLAEELTALHRLGFSQVNKATPPLDRFSSAHGLRFPDQGQFHVLKYLAGLVSAIEQGGGRTFAQTRAVDWNDEDGLTVTTEDASIRCSKAIVVATNYPIKSQMFPKLAPYRTYAIASSIPKDSMPPMLIWDTGEPYHYVRLQQQPDRDLLIVGGEDHRTGAENDGEQRFERLWEWTKDHFPFVENVTHRWSGQCLETHDGLAFLGRYSSDHPNVYMITGDSGMGMTHSTIGAMIVSDLVLGHENPWAKVYDPSRLATQSLAEAVPELLRSTVPYADRLTAGLGTSLDTVGAGEGAVISEGLSKIAVYRDEDGTVHKHSAVCVHMGCVVRFNSTEKTWDCPCHGSRFAADDGHAINAPANASLQKPK